MTSPSTFEIFLATAPGHESVLAAEARSLGFKNVRATAGGVTVDGGWSDVWRANLHVRGATRVLARIDSFRVDHLAKLDKRARRVPWGNVLRPEVSVRVEASCHKSRIYHSGAAAERITRAIAETIGAPHSDDATITVRARLDHDVCTIAVDTSGDSLHRRGHKEAVAKAPMRETMAALFLMQSGFRGTETVFDPMCGSGTFVIEAAEMAAGLAAGRSRSFAFEQLRTFDADAWRRLRDAPPVAVSNARSFGSDRDAGAARMSRANAARAGVDDRTHFDCMDIADAAPPDGALAPVVPGLVIMNAPYGARVGHKAPLVPLYRTIGAVMRSRFSGWRVALIATDASLARETGLPFAPPPAPISHGGLRVRLFLTPPLI